MISPRNHFKFVLVLYNPDSIKEPHFLAVRKHYNSEIDKSKILNNHSKPHLMLH